MKDIYKYLKNQINKKERQLGELNEKLANAKDEREIEILDDKYNDLLEQLSYLKYRYQRLGCDYITALGTICHEEA